jgi:cell division protein FtsZ
MSEMEENFVVNAKIKVIGIGGGGHNALNNMILSGLTGVEFIAANTDVQALGSSRANVRVQLGGALTKGLGAGANPDIGKEAALEDREILKDVLAGADMVFVTAGMGGGTGTGAAPVIAQIARDLGALTVGVVTKPFLFEGKKRNENSERGINDLRNAVDTLLTIPNQRLLNLAPTSLSLVEAFQVADRVLLNAVKGISDIINIPGFVNVDFADVKTVMSEMGMALMGVGIGCGPNRAVEAARSAISSPLLENVEVEGATGVLINITGSDSLTLHEINDAASVIQDAAHEDANIIFGAVIDPECADDVMRVTVVATGFDRIEIPERQLKTKEQKASPSLDQSQRHSVRLSKESPKQAMTERMVESQTQPRGSDQSTQLSTQNNEESLKTKSSTMSFPSSPQAPSSFQGLTDWTYELVERSYEKEKSQQIDVESAPFEKNSSKEKPKADESLSSEFSKDLLSFDEKDSDDSSPTQSQEDDALNQSLKFAEALFRSQEGKNKESEDDQSAHQARSLSDERA